MSATSSPIPLYHRVFAVLRQRVMDGAYPPGAQLPPEDDLVAEFGVSRSTIRQAVGELVNAGMVSRRQGRGTFVLDTAHASMAQVFTGNLMDLIGEVRRTKIQGVSLEHGVAIPTRIAEQLGLEKPVGTIVRRTRWRDDVAFGYTVNYLAPAIGRTLNKRELASKSLMDMLEQKGHRIQSAHQTIRAQLADVSVSEALRIPLGSAVLFVERLNTDADGQPVEFVQSWYLGDLYEFHATLERGPNGDDLRSQLA
jgi:GntR family transcriptional regulator